MNELNERAEAALRWLVAQPEPVYAFALCAHFEAKGLRPDGWRSYEALVAGAANTLKALRRRGLAKHDGGGAWVQVRWSATDRGREIAASLTEAEREARGDERDSKEESP